MRKHQPTKDRGTRSKKGAIRPVLVALLVFGMWMMAAPVRAAWTEPTGNPPGGNVAAPLNVSDTPQVKIGNLTVQGVFASTGTINADASPTKWYTIRGVGTGTTNGQNMGRTAGIWGEGGKANLDQTVAAGVYGISYTNTPGVGLHVGLLGYAGANTANSVGVYGWDYNNTSAFAGYFKGKVGVEGTLCLNNDCRSTWPEGGSGGGSLFTENPGNNTYLTNTGSNLAIGGTASDDAQFFFDVSASPGTFHAASEVIIGPQIGGFTIGDHICSPGETCGADCAGQPDSCPLGQVCDPNGGSFCTVLDQTPPSIPQNLRLNGTPGSTTIPLAWDAATDQGGAGMAGYKLYRCQGANCVPSALVQTLGMVTSFTDSGLTANTTYNYEITAIDGAAPPNESGRSNRLAATTGSGGGDAIPPTVPQNLRVDGGVVYSSVVPLAWDASTDTGGSGLAGYKLYKCQGTGCAPTYDRTLGLVTTLEDTAVTENTVYNYEVTAIDGAIPPNESGRSSRLQVTTPVGGGSSPILIKNPPIEPGGGTGYLPSNQTPSDVTNRVSYTEPASEPIIDGSRPLASMLGIPTAQAKFGLFEIPGASAAAPFEDGAIRLSIRDGVIQIKDLSGNILELGNGGSDIASTSSIILRPGTATQLQGATFAKNGTVTDLVLTGAIQIGNNSGTTPGTVRYTGADFQGYVDGQWKSFTTGGGGVDQNLFIWNVDPGQPGRYGDFQTARIKLTGGIFTTELGVSTTMSANPTNDVFYVHPTNHSVGINTNTPNANYKLDVNGNINTAQSYYQAGNLGSTDLAACGPLNTEDNTVVTNLVLRGGIVTGVSCEADTVGSGGGITGSGTANTIPLWLTASSLGNSVIQQSGTSVGIGLATPTSKLVIADGTGNATQFGFTGATSTTGYTTLFTMDNTGLKISENGSGRDMEFQTGNPTPATRLTILPSGNVGIAKTNPAYVLDVNGPANATQLGLSTMFISNWANLILNTGAGSPFAGQYQGTGSFNIGGDGRINQVLTVEGGILLPTTNRTTFANAIEEGGNSPPSGYQISSRYIFGANNTAPPSALGFFEDEDPLHVVVGIDENRNLQLGYTGFPTNLCLYGSGSADCRNTWPSGGGVDQNLFIWNVDPGQPGRYGDFQTARIKLTGGIFTTELGVSTTMSANPTNDVFYVHPTNHSVGINTNTPNANYKLDVNGNINTAQSYYQAGNLGSTDLAACGPLNTEDNTVVTNLVLRGGIVTGVSCEADTVGSGGGITGSGTANTIPLWLTASSLGNSVIQQSGTSVGIGLATPTSKLVIADGTGNATQFGFTGATSTSGYTTLFAMDNTGLKIGHDSPSRDLELRTNSATRLTILPSGNVGIGTTSPAELLAINAGSNSPGVVLQTTATGGTGSDGLKVSVNAATSAGYVWNYENASLAFGTNSLERLSILASGNVGIGTTTPSALFSVGGSDRFTVTSAGAVQTGSNGGDGQLAIYSEQGTTDYSILFRPNAAMTQATAYTLPPNDGDSGQVLKTDGVGNLTWENGGGGVVNNDQFIWNVNPAFPDRLGDFQTARIKLTGGVFSTQLGVSSSMGVPDPLNDVLYADGPLRKVGIGTASPVDKLTVISDSTERGITVEGGVDNVALRLTNTLTNGHSWGVYSTAGTSGAGVGSFAIRDVTTAAFRMVINASGNVGIGDNSPAALFTVGDNDRFMVSASGSVQSGSNGGDGQLMLYSEQGTTDYSILFRPNAAMTQATAYTLPPNDGDSGQVLTTDGGGALSWATAAGVNNNQFIWNVNPAEPNRLGDFQTARIKLTGGVFSTQLGVSSSMGVPDPLNDVFYADGPTGKVGIGTNSPGAHRLEVVDDAHAVAAAFGRTAAGVSGIGVGYDGGGIMFRDYGQAHAAITYNGTTDTFTFSGNTVPFGDGDYGTVKSYFNGSIGIGTDNPADLLQVYNSGANSGAGITVDSQGTLSGQMAAVNLLTLGDGTKGLGNAATKGWQLFARGNAWSNAPEQNDLGFSFWSGTGWNDAVRFDAYTGTTALLTVAPLPSAFALQHTFAAYNNSTTTAYNAVSGFKSGTGARGSGVYGELQSGMTCGAGQVCAGVSGSAGAVPGAGTTVAGIYGRATDANAWAGYFQGRVNITGTLTVNSKPITQSCFVSKTDGFPGGATPVNPLMTTYEISQTYFTGHNYIGSWHCGNQGNTCITGWYLGTPNNPPTCYETRDFGTGCDNNFPTCTICYIQAEMSNPTHYYYCRNS